MSFFKFLRKLGIGKKSGPFGKSGGFFVGLTVGVILFILVLSINNPGVFHEWFSRPDAGQNLDEARGPSEVCQVDRCVDGDTIIVFSKGKRERVRLIGVDTPETVKPNTPVQPFGPEASDYVKRRIEEFGGYVTLRTDGDPADYYGRRLAMVYLGKEGIKLLNEELIRRGLGKAELKFRYSDEMKSRFRRAERDAQKDRIGIWSVQR